MTSVLAAPIARPGLSAGTQIETARRLAEIGDGANPPIDPSNAGGTVTVSVAIGDRAPAIFGAAADGRFYSLDAQMGRPAFLVALGSLDAEGVRRALERVGRARALLEPAGIDIVPLAPTAAALDLAMGLAGDPEAARQIIYVAEGGGLEAARIDGEPAAVLIDRSGRIADILSFGLSFGEGADPGQYLEAAQAVRSEAGHLSASSAPVLIIPNVCSRDFCRALIDHFESAPQSAGVMASVKDGVAYAKLDEAKKRRLDVELGAESPVFGPVLDILAKRCAPEIKQAFQKDVAFIDRILLARYDETGGYFKRHRDNSAPHTAFRQFAISINLNTEEYEGGELQFPEYDDNRYSPPAGSAIIFSASLLHEVTPMLKGSRYVLLSFFCGEAAPAVAG
jgi:predicted 2-oxoglutarate/Fe(II)-dependent dioxygenase YbiX